MAYWKREAYYERSQDRGKHRYSVRTQNTTRISSAKLVAVETRTSTNTEKMRKMGTAPFSFISLGQIWIYS